MIRKIFTQLWNCRRANLWIWILLIVVTLLIWYAFDIIYNYEMAAHNPMGYDYDGVYTLDLRPRDRHADWNQTETDTRVVFNLLGEYPGVEAVSSGVGSRHFSNWLMFEGYCTHDDSSRTVSTYVRYVDPSYMDVFKIAPVHGSFDRERWTAGEYPVPAILTKDVADSLFNDASQAVGQTFFNPYAWKQGVATNYKVMAVVPNQKFDDYGRYEPMVLIPSDQYDLQMSTIFIRVRPEARTHFAERFSKDMRRQIENGSLYLRNVESMDDSREAFNMENGTVNYLNATYCLIGFFMFTVFLIVLGTFSIRTRHRRMEIGVKMAMGCTRRRVMTELITEGLLILTVAVIPATVMAVYAAHVELTVNTLTDMSATRFIVCFTGAVVLLATVIALAIWPSARKAMAISPAETLHDE